VKIDSEPARGASEGHNDEWNSVITCLSNKIYFITTVGTRIFHSLL